MTFGFLFSFAKFRPKKQQSMDPKAPMLFCKIRQRSARFGDSTAHILCRPRTTGSDRPPSFGRPPFRRIPGSAVSDTGTDEVRTSVLSTIHESTVFVKNICGINRIFGKMIDIKNQTAVPLSPEAAGSSRWRVCTRRAFPDGRHRNERCRAGRPPRAG